MIFQQDGVRPHFAREVRTWFNENLNGKWIGRGGSISWALCSPDFMPLDFFLWGYIKVKLHKTKANTIAQRNEREKKALKRHLKMLLMIV